MAIRELLEERLKEAMRAKNKVALTALRMIISKAKYAQIEAGAPLDDAAMTQVLVQLVKQYKDSIEQFGKGNRPDLVEKEEAELAIVEEFLPKALTGDELAALIAEGVAETGAVSPADMGKVMKWLGPRTVGRVDNKEVSALVRSALAGTQ